VYGQTWLDLQTTPPAVAWQMLRTLRANPPGNASKGDRKETFNAALEQAEQLFGAAANVGPAARPLLVFYGLSQAGRAIAAAALAANNDQYRLGGHGIRTGEMQGLVASGLAALTIENQGRGAFTQIADILDAASLPTTTPLGALWGLLPDNIRFPLPNAGAKRPVSIQLAPTTIRAHDVPVIVRGVPKALVYSPAQPSTDPSVDVAGWAAERQHVAEFLNEYPSLGDWEFSSPAGNPVGLQLENDSARVPLIWPNPGYAETEQVIVGRHTVAYRGQQRLAFPTVGGSTKPAHPFLLWWSILYALSMLARYEPKVWVNRIRINESNDATAIEYLLDQALILLPELIHRTIHEAAGVTTQ